jgi:predicted permease
MDTLLIMLKNVLIFVLLALPGYLLVKGKILGEKQSGAFSKLLTYVGMPFLILSSTLKISFDGEFLKSILFILVFGIAFIVATFFLTLLFTKKDRNEKRKGVARFCMVFANNGFLGIPLAKAVFGDSPVITYVIVLNIITNILMFIIGVYLISGDKKAISLKKAFLNPVLIAFIVGIVLKFLNVNEYVPEIDTYSTYFSNIVTPLSMVVLGMKMAGIPFVKLFSKWRTYYVSAIKLVVFPSLVVAILFLLRLFLNVYTDMIMGFFIAFAVPTAGLASAFADQYCGDVENATIYTLGTTLISVFTLPLLYWLLNILII